MAYVALTKAALGEKVPAKPPDSFQATRTSAPPLSLTKMPRSWLKPAFAVHRSVLAPGATVTLSAASMVCQVAPSELLSEYWLVETALYGLAPAGMLFTKRLVGEKRPPMGPAPMTMLLPAAGLLVF